MPPRVLNDLLIEEFRRLMDNRGLNQKALAEMTGLSESTLTRRFQGRTPWSSDEIEIVLMVLDVNLFDFLADMRNAKGRIR